jgi:hypothetical protein
MGLDDFSFLAQGFPSLKVRGSLVQEKKREAFPVHNLPRGSLMLCEDADQHKASPHFQDKASPHLK